MNGKNIAHAVTARVKRWHRDEEGMMVWAVLVAILFFLVMTAFVYNTGKTVAVKIETQNAADAMAYSSSVWTARGMNTITASNHLIGELNALYVLHHALGGKHLDEHSGANNEFEMVTTDAALLVASFGKHLPAFPFKGHDSVSKKTSADRNSAIFQAKLVLRIQMLILYAAHAKTYFAWLIDPEPISKAALAGTLRGLQASEHLIGLEYKYLHGVENVVAKGLRVPKKGIPDAIRALDIHQKLIATTIPLTTSNAIDKIAAEHGVRHDYTHIASLPVEPEKPKGELGDEKRSQLIRATHPWALSWGKPIADAMLIAPTSLASTFYTRWVTTYTLQSSEWLRTKTGSNYSNHLTVINYRGGGSGEKGKGIQLLVVRGVNATAGGYSKGNERWNDSTNPQAASREIDDRFCNLVFAKSNSAPKLAASAIFRQENPTGVICFAQSMIYNANNKQDLRTGSGTKQPDQAWDTLNWSSGVPEYNGNPSFLSSLGDIFRSASEPQIRLNWQAKLTPVTNYKLGKVGFLAGVQDQDIRDVMTSGLPGYALTNH
ncbi:hypothetical protein Poly24_01580 [Rosistilla carotiformis]|uniref:Uncharacterized protein n=1 Tax=Rosistilla carotiformis TaxID=2528017 RepID=A0A518JLR2_9BACT|nr:hypothetical protein [Rosistilla carotiformis]QDV66472.1 hypothetical protein Poly24_01580 [Rosistilla carotiformis]